jgi:hypothetical protein
MNCYWLNPETCKIPVKSIEGDPKEGDKVAWTTPKGNHSGTIILIDDQHITILEKVSIVKKEREDETDN